jgi:hydrogenase maturation factor
MAPGLVTQVSGDTAQVALNGVMRTALTLLTPDVQPGDWVLVGAGAILRRVDPAQAADLRRAVDIASGTTPPTDATPQIEPQGDPR